MQLGPLYLPLHPEGYTTPWNNCSCLSPDTSRHLPAGTLLFGKMVGKIVISAGDLRGGFI